MKSNRLDLRMDPKNKSLLERAATILGLSITAYATSALVNNAQEVIDRFERTVLSDRDRDLFLEALDSADKPNDALLSAVSDYKATVE
ncbi:MAG TPA: DUF1778 domain-containing protein [Fimbriimonadaceae bacterium]